MHLEVLVRAIAKDLPPARPEVGEPRDELLGGRGGCPLELNCRHALLLSILECQTLSVGFCDSLVIDGVGLEAFAVIFSLLSEWSEYYGA